MKFRFGRHLLDTECFELRRDGGRIELQPKALELLAHLVRHRDRVVDREELLEVLWPGVSVSSSSIARAVSLARRALGDSAEESRMIATISRHGYRFVAPVELEDELSAQSSGHRPGRERYVGRRALVQKTSASLDAALAGHGRILYLAGEAGIGKTRTAQLLIERARAARAEVFSVWGLAQPSPTFWFWSCLLGRLIEADPKAFDSLSTAQRAQVARILVDHDTSQSTLATGSGEAARVRLFEAVVALLARAARRRPLALLVDDLHGADAESIALLEYTGRALDTLAIAFIATCREDDAALAPQQARALERLMRAGSLERWTLQGLGEDDLAQFVEHHLGHAPPPSLLQALAHQTGGNPLLIYESLRSLEARDLLDGIRDHAAWESILPRGIDHLLRPKLAQLSAGALETLTCASAIGTETDRQQLERCTSDPACLDAWLDECASVGLIQLGPGRAHIRFAHGLLREAAYASLLPTPTARQAQHARIARTLDGGEALTGHALAEAARHACLAVPRVDPRTAAALARRAAMESERLFDFESAARWVEQAIAAQAGIDPPDRVLQAELLLDLARLQTRSIGLERSRAAHQRSADAARAAGRPDLFALAALGFAQRPNSTGQGDPEVVALLDEALAGLPGDAVALRIRVGSRLAAELRYSERERMAILGAQALAEARELGDPLVLAQTLDDAAYMQWSAADPKAWVALNAEVARWARVAGDVDLEVGGLKSCVSAALEQGDLVGAQRSIRAVGRIAAAVPIPYARWWCSVLEATQLLLVGDFAEAESRVLESLRIAERIDSPEIAIELQAQIVYLRTEQGRAAEIFDAAREQVRLFPNQPLWRTVLARLACATGDLAEARRALAPLVADGFSGIPIDRGWMATHALAAEVVEALRDVDAAESLLARLRPFSSRTVVAGSSLYYGPVTHYLGLLEGVRSNWDPAIEAFEAAIASEKQIGATVFGARTRLAFARVVLQRNGPGDRARAGRLVREGLETARRGGFASILADYQELDSALWRPAGNRRPARTRTRAGTHGSS